MNDTEPQKVLGGGAAAAIARIERTMQRRREGTQTLQKFWNSGEIGKADLPCHDACNGEIRVYLPLEVVNRHELPSRSEYGFCPAHMQAGVCPLVTLRERQLLARMKHADFGQRYVNPDPERIRCRQVVEQYLGNLDANVREGRGLVFTGDVGVGKTMILGYMARRMLSANVGVWKAHFPAFIDGLQDRQRKLALVERAIRVEVLMIDDFGSGEIAPWVIGVLEGVIESRYGNNKPTIVTTNIGKDELVANPDFRRIVDRWRETSTMIRIAGESQRTGNA